MPETRSTNPLVDQFRHGGVPLELRLLAAQGTLPLKPTDLVELVHLLLDDAEGTVRQAARATLASYPAAELLPMVKDKETPPAVLAWCLEHRPERELRESVLQNVATSDDAIRLAAPGLSSELAELVVINQVRLLRCTPLLVALEGNASLNNDQKRRLRELRESFHIGEQPEAPPPAPVAAPPPVPAEPDTPIEENPPASEQDALVRYLSDDERQDDDTVSAIQRLYRMTTAEKVITALRGSREERALLVRDANRIVSTAVLGSPRLTEPEIEAFAGMKTVSDDVLRRIAKHRDWTKRYGVVLNLVKNPRTPLAFSLGFVSRLNPRDMKSIATDRNVPEVIRVQASRFVRAPLGPGGGAKR